MWEISNYNQIVTFALSVCLGAIFCVFYDIFRALRQVCLNTILLINICDVFIWIIYAFTTFIFLIARTNGEVRGYVLCGELLGFVLIRLSVSKFIVKYLGIIFIKILLLNGIISKRFYFFFHKCEKYVLKSTKYVPKTLKSIKKFLKNTVRLLYNDKNIEDAKRSLNETKTEA